MAGGNIIKPIRLVLSRFEGHQFGPNGEVLVPAGVRIEPGCLVKSTDYDRHVDKNAV
jgi:hypothetical protein